MINTPTLTIRIACLIWLVHSTSFAIAAEQVVLRFVETPRTSEYVVRLGDLVEVLAGKTASVERMLELPLGPSPREGAQQTWHCDDVLQHLELRGIHPSNIRWSGVTQIELQRITSHPEVDSASMEPAFVQARTIQLAENLVAQAIAEYLNLKTGERTDWRIAPQIPAKLADVIRIRRNIVSIGGGNAPWLGQQQFVLQLKDGEQIVNVAVPAQVTLPPMVVVAKRPLRREEILTAEILDYAPMSKRDGEDQGQYYTDIDELIGKQLKRSVSTALPISREYVGSPIVIQRNEMIEVESASGAIIVRTMARSLASGAVGDLIDVELIPSKHRMLAAVVGPLKVRVAAVSSRGAMER